MPFNTGQAGFRHYPAVVASREVNSRADAVLNQVQDWRGGVVASAWAVWADWLTPPPFHIGSITKARNRENTKESYQGGYSVMIALMRA